MEHYATIANTHLDSLPSCLCPAGQLSPCLLLNLGLHRDSGLQVVVSCSQVWTGVKCKYRKCQPPPSQLLWMHLERLRLRCGILNKRNLYNAKRRNLLFTSFILLLLRNVQQYVYSTTVTRRQKRYSQRNHREGTSGNMAVPSLPSVFPCLLPIKTHTGAFFPLYRKKWWVMEDFALPAWSLLPSCTWRRKQKNMHRLTDGNKQPVCTCLFQVSEQAEEAEASEAISRTWLDRTTQRDTSREEILTGNPPRPSI